MKKRNICTVILLLSLVGCTTTFKSQSSGVSNESDPIISLNSQIEQWNSRKAGGGFSSISQRVFRVVYNPWLGRVKCFDKEGEAFLVLNRDFNGRFKGIMEVEYHFASWDSESDFGDESGVISVEFYLDKGMF